ncbi:hypothetical protein STAPHY8AQ_110050 [Staphylococcus sp. 8AQ]|nr:hypothetical protein STAPHY8AQ_110050 [Staphylococcus sp. 8AQ]
MDDIEHDFNYIARYKIEKNDRDQKSDAAIHVFISKIDVKRK